MTVYIVAYGPVLTPDTIEGEFLKAYDPEAFGGFGTAEFTTKLPEAMSFPDAAAAITFSRQVPQSRPFRTDGRENRPLTTFHLEFLNEEDAKKLDEQHQQREREREQNKKAGRNVDSRTA
jgi:hypothetical protein